MALTLHNRRGFKEADVVRVMPHPMTLLELSDVSREMLENPDWDERYEARKIVIVRFSNGRCLTFLVTDTKTPQVPGYPAHSLSFFDSHQQAVEAVKQKLKEIDYMPKHQDYGYFTR